MLRSLLLSRDETTVRMVARGFKDLEVKLEDFSEAATALSHAIKSPYDAVVVDDQVKEACIFLEKLIALPACNKSVRIVLAEPVALLNTVFKTGTQFIIYTPLSSERSLHDYAT